MADEIKQASLVIGANAESAAYFRSYASVRGMALNQSTKDNLLRLDLLNKKIRKHRRQYGKQHKKPDGLKQKQGILNQSYP